MFTAASMVATQNVDVPLSFMCRISSSSNVTISKSDSKGFTLAAFRMTSVSNVKVRESKSDSSYLATFDTGGNNVLFDRCAAGTLGLIANGSPDPATNVTEFGTEPF